MRPYPANIDKNIPNNIIHLSAAKDSICGKTIHENESMIIILSGMINTLLRLKDSLTPIIPVGRSDPVITINNTKRFVGLTIHIRPTLGLYVLN